MDSKKHAAEITRFLGLRHQPVAIAFIDTIPPGVPHVSKEVPSGCTFWAMASEGQTFYTDPADHLNCPVGAHTHGIKVPEERRHELGALVQTMVGLEYLREEEVPQIPVLRRAFVHAIYAPLADSPCEPDVVLLRANARQLMIASEAAVAAGLTEGGPLRGRPTCAMVPEVLQTVRSSSSFACIGNRVYTGLPDDEFYFAVPGTSVAKFASKLSIIASANVELEGFHRKRLAQYTGA
jgi:uncharacterized protein (DUF169 family)